MIKENKIKKYVVVIICLLGMLILSGKTENVFANDKKSKDMENIRRLSHDIKNHLEVLKENIEPEQKIEYINGIERKLNKYQSYYKSGNTFIDN